MPAEPIVFILTESEPHPDFPGERVLAVASSLDGAQKAGDRFLRPNTGGFGRWVEERSSRTWCRKTTEANDFQTITPFRLEP